MHLARTGGRFPLTARGRINTYPLFAELCWRLLGPRGRSGFIVPSGIATDDNTKFYFQGLMRNAALVSLWEFENKRRFFPDATGGNVKFALVTLSGAHEPFPIADFLFQGDTLDELAHPERHFSLSIHDIESINPNTGNCPIFKTQRDAKIALSLYQRFGILWREGHADGNPWGLRFMQGTFNMASDSGLFRTRSELTQAGWTLEGNRFVKDGQVMLLLYEAKMADLYNHRSGSYELAASGERPHRLPAPTAQQLADPYYAPLPFYWVAEGDVEEKLAGVWSRDWFLGWRDITDARTVARTVVTAVISRSAVGDTFLLAMPSVGPESAACLCANLSSLALDYAARQKVGGLHLKYNVFRQLPVLPPSAFEGEAPWSRTQTTRHWLLPRILELTYTAWDLQPFARDCGDEGPPFIWDPDRRFRLQCELDAAFFHLYGLARDDAEYILGTFEVLERAETRTHGEFRTRRVVVECYDALAQAITTGQPYRSPLGPPRRAE